MYIFALYEKTHHKIYYNSIHMLTCKNINCLQERLFKCSILKKLIKFKKILKNLSEIKNLDLK